VTIGKRLGLSVARASWLVGISVRDYRALEDGESYPEFETWDRICKLYGWPQTFVGRAEAHSQRGMERTMRSPSVRSRPIAWKPTRPVATAA
jgi:hypothetical protein